MSRNRASTAIALAILATAVVLPRMQALGTLGLMQYNWFGRVENFVDALANGRFADTFQNPHPGVTLMWITGGVLTIARRLSGPVLGADRVWVFELAQVIWAVVVMPLLFLALRRALVVYGEGHARATWIALAPCLLIALDPMVITMTRAVSLDGPLGLQGALGVCLFLIALRTRRVTDELLAGVVAGLTVLTKTPGLIFVFGMGLWLLVRAVHMRRSERARRSAVSLVLIPATAAATFIVAWPAMWVAPAQTLQQIAVTSQQAEEIERADFGKLLVPRPGAKGEDALLDVILHPHKAGDANVLFGRIRAAWQYYPAVILFKTPPATLILVAVGALIALRAWRRRSMDATLRLFASTLFFALLYLACMNVAAKKTWRYMVPLQVFLELGAGLAFAWLVQATLRTQRRWAAALLGIALVLQSAHVLTYAPHFLTYYNPLLGGRSVAEQYVLVYWGDGVGEAARYMRDHATRHPVRFVAKGSVAPRARIMMGDGQPVRDLRDAEFLVIDYRALLQRSVPEPARIYWETRRPEHVVWIQGVPYMWIYRVDQHGAPGF